MKIKTIAAGATSCQSSILKRAWCESKIAADYGGDHTFLCCVSGLVIIHVILLLLSAHAVPFSWQRHLHLQMFLIFIPFRLSEASQGTSQQLSSEMQGTCLSTW